MKRELPSSEAIRERLRVIAAEVQRLRAAIEKLNPANAGEFRRFATD
jgi:hypothetical protein